MTPEEFYKTQFTHPVQMDNYYKAGIRFSYNDLIKFAQDYHNSMRAETMLELERNKREIQTPVVAVFDGSYISPQFCPQCSPNTWANYRFAAIPAKAKCTSCGYEHSFQGNYEEKTAEVYYCRHCLALNEEDCCCNESEEE